MIKIEVFWGFVGWFWRVCLSLSWVFEVCLVGRLCGGWGLLRSCSLSLVWGGCWGFLVGVGWCLWVCCSWGWGGGGFLRRREWEGWFWLVCFVRGWGFVRMWGMRWEEGFDLRGKGLIWGWVVGERSWWGVWWGRWLWLGGEWSSWRRRLIGEKGGRRLGEGMKLRIYKMG